MIRSIVERAPKVIAASVVGGIAIALLPFLSCALVIHASQVTPIFFGLTLWLATMPINERETTFGYTWSLFVIRVLVTWALVVVWR